jgi:hypothetical protein
MTKPNFSSHYLSDTKIIMIITIATYKSTLSLENTIARTSITSYVIHIVADVSNNSKVRYLLFRKLRAYSHRSTPSIIDGLSKFQTMLQLVCNVTYCSLATKGIRVESVTARI